MLPSTKLKTLILLLATIYCFTSCSFQQSNNNVDLFVQVTDNLVYEEDSETPYTGTFVHTAKTDKLVVDFKNGLQDGAFLRYNENGDTLRYSEYDAGKELFSIQYTYNDGKLTARKKSEIVTGNAKDREIFTKALTMIKHKEFIQLDTYLNPLVSAYKGTFTTCEQLFGPFQEFNIKEVTKEYVEHQDAHHLIAKIDLKFRDKTLDVGFLIIKYSDELKGEGFSFPTFDYDLKPDNLITKMIKSVNEKNADALIKNSQFEEKHKEAIKKDFDKIGNIDESAAFVNCRLGLFQTTQLSKRYLTKVNGEKKIIEMLYEFNADGNIEFRFFQVMPYRRPY
ncbi:MAG: hypothetical protein AAF611_09565 [Bacteroidota bacterium]